MVLNEEEEARLQRLEEELERLKRERDVWLARGLEELRFRSLSELFAAKGHTH